MTSSRNLLPSAMFVRRRAADASGDGEICDVLPHDMPALHRLLSPLSVLDNAGVAQSVCSTDDDEDVTFLYGRWPGTCRMIFGMIVASFVVATAGSAATCHTCWTQALRVQAINDGSSVAALFEGAVFQVFHSQKNPCAEYANLKLVSVAYSNLGHKGPDVNGHEGILWKAVTDTHYGADVGYKELLIHGTAEGTYSPFSPGLNGMQGNYGSINLQGGSEVNLTFTVYDAESKKRVALPNFSVSFFDMGVDAESGKPLQTITLSKFSTFFRDDKTEVNVSKHADGATTFSGRRAYGAGGNYHIGRMIPSTERLRHTFSVVYRNAPEVGCHLRAGPGHTPRLFTFAFGPSVLCLWPFSAVDFRPPLPDLELMPPLEVPVAAGPSEIFVRWLVKKGDIVRKGDEICKVKKLGLLESHKAPCKGTVKELQVSLRAEDELDARLSEKTLAVIARLKLDKLKLPHGSHPAAVARRGTYFVSYPVKVHDIIQKGDVIAVIQNEGGLLTKVCSTAQGFVLALQQQIANGDPVELVPDRILAVIGPLSALKVHGAEVPIVAPVGYFFVRWHRKKGDFLKKGEPVCSVRGPKGDKYSLPAPRDGLLRAMQPDLPQELAVDAAVQDRILATIGPLPPLDVPLGKAPVLVPRTSDWLFDSWKVKMGAHVRKGDAVAMMRHVVNSSKRAVLASKDGMVVVMQKHLHNGSNITETVQDCNIAVIGKFVALVASKRQLAVEVPPDVVFKRWRVTPGTLVEKGSAVADVIRVDVVGGSTGSLAAISAPGTGLVATLQPLIGGESISTQQHGRIIALLDVPPAPTSAAPTSASSSTSSSGSTSTTSGSQPWWISYQRIFALAIVGLCTTLSLLYIWNGRRTANRDMPSEPACDGGSEFEPTDKESPRTFETNLTNLTLVTLSTFSESPPSESVQPASRCATPAISSKRAPEPVAEISDDWGQPTQPLRLSFRPAAAKDSSAYISCTFTEQPLGLFLDKRLPRIRKVQAGSPAHTAGIQEGWMLASIGDHLVPHDFNSKEPAKMLREAVALLPDSGKKFGSAPWRPWGNPSKF